MMRTGRKSIILLVMLLVAMLLILRFPALAWQPERLDLHELAYELERGNVRRLVVDETEVEIIFTDGSMALARKEGSRTLVEQLLDLGVPSETLTSDHVRIEVGRTSLMNALRTLPLLVAAGAGVVLGAGLMLLAMRKGCFRG